ncbi:MAG: ISNCY family transposase [Anaerolineales bacterium]|jgi:hypothetical protein
MKGKKVFDTLIKQLANVFGQLPEHRRGTNTQYEIKDAAIAAFSVFFLQEPSFLAYQRMLEKNKGKNNLNKIFGVEKIPTDPQIRNLLDPISPEELQPFFTAAFGTMEETGLLKRYESYGGQKLISSDGTQTISSQNISCQSCSHQELANGEKQSYHSAILPVVAKAGESSVLALSPEFITPQDGHQKQDCERAALKRWVAKNAGLFKGGNYTMLGDDLYANQPMCEAFFAAGLNFILVCKPDSHVELYRMVDFLAKGGHIQESEQRHWNGTCYERHRCRFVNQVPLREKDPLLVNWMEILIVREDTDEHIYHNSFVTNHAITAENVIPLIRDGRTRWKSENETNNILKNHGYHLEHNFGHGNQHLANTLATLNLIAFLFHTLLDLLDEPYQHLRTELVTRFDFFNDLRALLRYMIFEDWDALIFFMLRGLEVPGYI